MENLYDSIEDLLVIYFTESNQYKRYDIIDRLASSIGEPFIELLQLILKENDAETCLDDEEVYHDYDTDEEACDIYATGCDDDMSETTTAYDANIEYLKSIGAL